MFLNQGQYPGRRVLPILASALRATARTCSQHGHSVCLVQEEEVAEGAAKDEEENGSEGKEGSEKGDEAESDDDADDEGSGDSASTSNPCLLICNRPNWHSKAAVARP